jgi:hypothetical protein
MKKLIFFLSLILVCAFFSHPCYSQIDLVLGISKSSITGGDSWRDPWGIQAGAILPILNFNQTLSLRVEGNFSMQGAKWEDYDTEGRLNLLYLNAPLVIRYKGRGGFFGEAGIQVGLLLSAKDKWEDISENIKDYMNIFDFSIPLGVGYEFRNNLGLGLRVIPGISDITEDEDEVDRNFVIALRGTYKLNFK